MPKGYSLNPKRMFLGVPGNHLAQPTDMFWISFGYPSKGWCSRRISKDILETLKGVSSSECPKGISPGRDISGHLITLRISEDIFSEYMGSTWLHEISLAWSYFKIHSLQLHLLVFIMYYSDRPKIISRIMVDCVSVRLSKRTTVFALAY